VLPREEGKMPGVELLTVAELAAELRVPKTTIYKWRANRSGPRATRVGKYLRFARADVDEWLVSCRDGGS
jgi:excisionase family DNA binding protein